MDRKGITQGFSKLITQKGRKGGVLLPCMLSAYEVLEDTGEVSNFSCANLFYNAQNEQPLNHT